LFSTLVDQVRTSGPRPNTEFLASSLGADVLTEQKHVRVTPQLQVIGHPSVFAAGDIMDWPEEKQFGKTIDQAPVVAENMVSYLADKPLKKKYSGAPEAIFLTNGKVRVSALFFSINVSDRFRRHPQQSSGAAYLPFLWGIVLGPWFARMVKSKTLMLEAVRSKMSPSQ